MASKRLRDDSAPGTEDDGYDFIDLPQQGTANSPTDYSSGQDGLDVVDSADGFASSGEYLTPESQPVGETEDG